MYAIVQHGGHQYRLAPGDRLVVDRLAAEVGSTVTLEPVLLLGGVQGEDSGLDAARGARVTAVVVGHRLGRKLRIFKYKPKKRHRRTRGHRSRYTELRVEALLTAGQHPPAAATAAPATAAAPAGASGGGAAPDTKE
jgi:large subunit ribosomal protein L21